MSYQLHTLHTYINVSLYMIILQKQKQKNIYFQYKRWYLQIIAKIKDRRRKKYLENNV